MVSELYWVCQLKQTGTRCACYMLTYLAKGPRVQALGRLVHGCARHVVRLLIMICHAAQPKVGNPDGEAMLF